MPFFRSVSRLNKITWTVKLCTLGLPWLDFPISEHDTRASPRIKKFIEEELQKNEEFVQKNINVELALLPSEMGFNYGVGKPTSLLFQNKFILHVPRTLLHRLEAYDYNESVMRSFQTDFFPLNEEKFLIDRFCIAHEVGHMIHNDLIKTKSLATVSMAVIYCSPFRRISAYVGLGIASVLGYKAFQRNLEKKADQYSIQFFNSRERRKIAEWLMMVDELTLPTNSLAYLMRDHPSPRVRAKDILQYNSKQQSTAIKIH